MSADAPAPVDIFPLIELEAIDQLPEHDTLSGISKLTLPELPNPVTFAFIKGTRPTIGPLTGYIWTVVLQAAIPKTANIKAIHL